MSQATLMTVTFFLIIHHELNGQCTTEHCHIGRNSQENTCPNKQSLTDILQLMLDLDSKQHEAVARLEKDIKSSVKEKMSLIDLRMDTQNASFKTVQTFPNSSCWKLLQSGTTISGVHDIRVDFGRGKAPVYCDMDTNQGGYTVFQRRGNGSVNFYQDWAAYSAGFGDLDGEFWLGNNFIHELTSLEPQELRVDLWDFDDNTAYAEYQNFRVGPESDNFRLFVSGYNGTAGDSLREHSGLAFSTRDSDHDNWSDGNCAEDRLAAWWYNHCDHSNLNGLWLNDITARGIVWDHWKGPNVGLKASRMMMRPQRRT